MIWTIEEIAAAILPQGTKPPAATGAVTGVCIDSRAVQPGDLFVALRGERADGAQFVDDAIARGAVAAIAHDTYRGAHPDKVFIVPDVLCALEQLGAAARVRSKAYVIGIAGSVGKTSTKEFLAHILSGSGKVHATQGNLNNHIGLPLTLARMPQDADFAVLEMGMNHPGELAPLAALGRPHAAIITNVDIEHLEHFANVAGIADAEAEILSGTQSLAILNHDNTYYMRLLGHAHGHHLLVESFGSADDCAAQVTAMACDATGTDVTARLGTEILQYRIGVPGAHWVGASLSILLAARAAGVAPAVAAPRFASLKAAKGRGASETRSLPNGGTVTVIDESYNASPAAVTASLALLSHHKGRKIAALGDMLELGPQGPALHRAIAADVITQGVDLLFCAGPLMQVCFEDCPPALRGQWAADAEALAPAVISALRDGDVLLVKGSRGMKMEMILSALPRIEQPKA